MRRVLSVVLALGLVLLLAGGVEARGRRGCSGGGCGQASSGCATCGGFYGGSSLYGGTTLYTGGSYGGAFVEDTTLYGGAMTTERATLPAGVFVGTDSAGRRTYFIPTGISFAGEPTYSRSYTIPTTNPK